MGSQGTDDAKVLDAREIDGEPFGDITVALNDLGEDETLLLVNSFEPVPLYDVLSDRGLEYETTRVSQAEWQIEISQ